MNDKNIVSSYDTYHHNKRVRARNLAINKLLMILQGVWAAVDRLVWAQLQCLGRRVHLIKTTYKCLIIEISFNYLRLRVLNRSRQVFCLLDLVAKGATQPETTKIIQVNNILNMTKCAGPAIKN